MREQGVKGKGEGVLHDSGTADRGGKKCGKVERRSVEDEENRDVCGET